MSKIRRGRAEFLQYLLIAGVLRLAMALPYQTRVRFIGCLVTSVVSPLAGWRKRIRSNLDLIKPDLSDEEVARIVREVPKNFGRSLIESFSGQEFIDRVSATQFTGAGVAELEAARDQGKPVILVTGHFGNHQAPRAALIAKGYRVGGLYMPMSNGFFNDRYVAELTRLGEPLFERSRHGLAEMVRFLKTGGMVGMVADHHMYHGVQIEFMGAPAYTALSAAEMALKYDALLIPIYGCRTEDGFGLEVIVDAPVPNSEPVEMTRALNASLEKLVEAHPEQWFWIHRRWKEH